MIRFYKTRNLAGPIAQRKLRHFIYISEYRKRKPLLHAKKMIEWFYNGDRSLV